MPATDMQNWVFGTNSSWNTGGYQAPNVNWGGPTARPRGVATTPTGAGAAANKFDISQTKELGQIADIINQINKAAQTSALQARIPNAPALEAKSSANIGQELSGQVPSDVTALLQQQAAERGVATGVGAGSPNANAAYLRALGLTSLGQEQTGQQNLSAAYARNPAAPIFDPTKLLMTPEQLAATNLGYMSEADRTALEQQRLAIEAARGGGGGGGRGGYGSYGGTTTASSPYQYAEPGTYAYGPTGTTTGLTGSGVMPGGDMSQADWLASIGITQPSYSTGADEFQTPANAGGTDYSQLFPNSVDYSSGEGG